jgi:hypothetical protein
MSTWFDRPKAAVKPPSPIPPCVYLPYKGGERDECGVYLQHTQHAHATGDRRREHDVHVVWRGHAVERPCTV